VTLPSEFVVHVARILETLGIPYHVGGSLASSAHGMYRASADVDLVIDATSEQLEALAAALGAEFYVSPTAMREAHDQRGTFNAIHVPTSFKIDFFLKGRGPFDSEELSRSLRQRLGGPGTEVLVKSPEDTILRKLDWYRRGGEVSERQWRDVLSILTVMPGQLDDAYLDRWAGELGVRDLLDRVRGEARRL